MEVLALVVSCGLSGVLLWAGLEKFRAHERFGATLTEVGMPAFATRAARVAVPVAEMLIAGGLLLIPAAPWPRAGAAALGAVFAIVGVIALRTGRRISCECLVR